MPNGAHRRHDVHRARRDDDRRLHAHPPAHLPQRRAAERHAPLLRALRARRHRRSPAPGDYHERDARPPATPRAAGTAIRRATSSCRRARSRARASRRWPATPATRTTLQIAVGCFNGAATRRASAAAGGAHRPPALRRATSSLNDPTRAGRVAVEASGLLRRRRARRLGRRSRSTPTDNGGIRRVELVDVTPAARGVVGAEDYATGARTDTRRDLLVRASPRPARTSATRPCARPALAAGRRHAAGPRHRRRRQRHRAGPVRGRRRHAVRPRRRSTAPARPTAGTLTARFTRPSASAARPSATARGSASRGRLLNAAASRSPARCSRCSRATAARARASSSAARRRTSADGSLSAYRVRAAASRLLQFAWRVARQRPAAPQAERLPDAATRARPSSLRATPAARSASAGALRAAAAAVRGAVPARGVPGDLPGPRRRRGRYDDVRRRPRRPQRALQASTTASAPPPRAGARSRSASSSAATRASRTRPATPSACASECAERLRTRRRDTG